jgi:hypothetical protein
VFVFIVRKKWKSIPLFLVGFFVISFLGYLFVYDHLLWLFQTNPYTSNNGFDHYGTGSWIDYFVKFYYMTGIPFIILFWISTVFLFVGIIFQVRSSIVRMFSSIEFILFALFFSFFLSHVVFWKFGLFHSFGMSRVLISITPIALLIVLYLLHRIIQYSFKLKGVVVVCILSLTVFPFLNNPSAWNYSKEFAMNPELKAMKEIQKEFNLDSLHASRIYYSSTPLMTIWNYDVYDTAKLKSIRELQFQKPTSSRYIVVVEDWFMNIDCNVMRSDSLFLGLKKVYSKKVSDVNTVDIYINQ